MWCRTAIESYSRSPNSGKIFTIAFEPELYMIDQIILLKVVWRCSVQLVHRWISTYPLRRNGKPTTGKEDVHFYCLHLQPLHIIGYYFGPSLLLMEIWNWSI